jgi:tetratricopeptide (TPR) repeat protein
MINTCLSVSVENNYLEPFEDRIDILFRELELATKWQRPSVLLAIYSSEYVRADADIALENRLHALGQSAYHIKIKNQAGADVSLLISELADLNNVVFFVEGLRWGAGQDNCYAYHTLNNRREFFIENQIRVVFWLTEKEAIDLAHYAPDYWAFRHRVIEFVDSPKPDQISPHVLESAWQGTGEFTDATEDLDAKIALRTALLTDLPTGNESTAARANLLLTLGMLHWRRGDYERATQFLNTTLDLAARLEDNCFEALCFNAIALVQTDLGRVEEAIQAYQNAISLAPEQISPWNNLGHLYRKLERHTEALAAFQKAIEQNSSDALGWTGLGDLYRETGHNDDAIYAYLKAIEFSPDYAYSWSGLGNSYRDEGQLDDALAAHQKALEIDRGTVNSWLGLGDIHRMQGNSENASMAYRTALELDPKNALAWNQLGNLYYSAGAFDEAMRSYRKGIEFTQGSCLSYSNLASIYIDKGLHTEAIPLLLKAVELSDDKTDLLCLWNRLGDTYRRLDDYDNAMAAYRKADALALETASPQTESSTVAPDSQPTPSEGIPAQPVSQLEFDPGKEEPLLPESSKPAIVRSPDNILVPNDTDTISTKPDADNANWLDGLASVMPVISQSEMTGTIESNPIGAGLTDETGSVPDLQSALLDAAKEPEPEPACQAYNTEESIPLVGKETCFSNESSPDVPERQILSDVPFENDTSVPAGQTLRSAETTEETDPALVNEDLDTTAHEETAVISDPASEHSVAESEDANQNQVTINEENAQIWNELGNIYYNTGAFDEAMHAFEMAIELDPSYGWSYNNLASIYFHQKRFADAIPLYQKGLQLLDDYKDRALLWNRLGDAYRRLDEHDQAAAAYRKAIELNPENVSLLTRARFSLLGNRRA